jgi:hypothetical protein
MQRNVTVLLVALGLTILLAACESTPLPLVINSDQAIKLAKEAAAHLKFPPRRADEGTSGGYTIVPSVYYTYPNEVALWPDTPGTVQIPANVPLPPISNFSNFSMPQDITTMTLESKVGDDGKGGGLLVTFAASWQVRVGSADNHSWQFHVDTALKASFLGEGGDELQKVVMLVP